MLNELEDPVSRKFLEAVGERNFISFETLAGILGLSVDAVIAKKPVLEATLREEDPAATLTSRVDLSPPGFEIKS